MAHPTFLKISAPDPEFLEEFSKILSTDVPEEYKRLFKINLDPPMTLLIVLKDINKQENIPFHCGFLTTIGTFVREKVKNPQDFEFNFSGKSCVETACFLSASGPWVYKFDNDRDNEKFSKILEEQERVKKELKILSNKVG